MLAIDVLIKAITLLHRENELGSNEIDTSKELVRTVLEVMNSTATKLYHGGESDILENLKHLLQDMINNPDNYDKESLLQSLELIIKDNENLLKVVDKAINVELSKPSLKRTILSLRNTLNNYYKEEQLKKLISAASYKLSAGKLVDESIQEYASKLATNIEALTMVTKSKDPGIVDEIDMSDEESMSVTLDKVKGNSEGGTKLITGWKELNTLTQGKHCITKYNTAA